MSQQEAVRHFMSWVITARTCARAGDAPGAVRCLDADLEGPGNAYLMHAIDPSSPDADPLPAADEAAGQPAAPTPLPGAAGDRPPWWADRVKLTHRLALAAGSGHLGFEDLQVDHLDKDDRVALSFGAAARARGWVLVNRADLAKALHAITDDRPWHDDPQEIARLWRWLDEQCQLPPDVAEFIERADLWPEERERMVREQGRVTTDG